MIRSRLKSFALAAVLAWAPLAQAGVLFQQLPLSRTDGVQSDDGFTPYTQEFVVAPNSTLDRIVWWGFNGLDLDPSTPDSFEVTIDGIVQTGSVTAQVGQLFTRYVLDVPDAPIVSGVISIANFSGAREWFWQTAASAGLASNAGSFGPTAFQLLSPSGRVPLPATAWLAVLGLALVARRRPTC